MPTSETLTPATVSSETIAPEDGAALYPGALTFPGAFTFPGDNAETLTAAAVTTETLSAA